jgi:hypothetical protein
MFKLSMFKLSMPRMMELSLSITIMTSFDRMACIRHLNKDAVVVEPRQEHRPQGPTMWSFVLGLWGVGGP